MVGHKICLCGEIWPIIPKLSLLPLFILSTVVLEFADSARRETPCYWPDLAPSDFFLFSNLKTHIRECHFRSDEKVVMAVEEWVNGKDSDFFSSRLMALEHRWPKCITLEGNYIEKKRSIGNKFVWLLIDLPSYFTKFHPSHHLYLPTWIVLYIRDV